MRQSTRVLIALLAFPFLSPTLLAGSSTEILSEGSPEQINAVISAMKRLESQTSDPEQKIKLRINSIRLEVGLAQKIRLSEEKDKNRNQIDKAFSSAETRATALDQNLNQMFHLSEKYRYQVYFLRGVARYYLGKTKESLLDFDRYLNTPQSKKDKEREWVLQVAAEENFEAKISPELSFFTESS